MAGSQQAGIVEILDEVRERENWWVCDIGKTAERFVE